MKIISGDKNLSGYFPIITQWLDLVGLALPYKMFLFETK